MLEQELLTLHNTRGEILDSQCVDNVFKAVFFKESLNAIKAKHAEIKKNQEWRAPCTHPPLSVLASKLAASSALEHGFSHAHHFGFSEAAHPPGYSPVAYHLCMMWKPLYLCHLLASAQQVQESVH